MDLILFIATGLIADARVNLTVQQGRSLAWEPGGGKRGMCPPPPLKSGKDMLVPPPPSLWRGLHHGVGPVICAPPPILSRSYAVEDYRLKLEAMASLMGKSEKHYFSVDKQCLSRDKHYFSSKPLS